MPSEHASALRRGARVAWTAALGAVLVAACTGSGAEDLGTVEEPSTTSTEPATTTAEPTVVPSPTAGELRLEVRGRGASGAPEHVLLVGDSVLVLVADELPPRLSSTLHVDAADCRRIDLDVRGPCGGVPAGTVVDDGIDAIERNMAELSGVGVVPDAAVLVLADNSALAEADLHRAMEALEPVPKVWWVTARIDGYGRQDPNNELLADLARRDERAGIIDWFGESDGRDWLADHVHPNDEGSVALARLIARQVTCGCEP